MHGPPWAPGYLHRSAQVAPVGFRYKEQPEDFVVVERTAEPPSGAGSHLWLWVEKRGLSTIEAACRLAAALGREPQQVGFAGRKDVRAVTRQWISVEGADADRARGLALEDLTVLEVERSDRGLRMGALTGNRFELVLRGLDVQARPRVEQVLAQLEERGLPNYYGKQRFGFDGRTQDLGRRLLEGDEAGYLAAYLTGEGPAALELLRRIQEGTWAERRAAGELIPRLDGERAELARQLVRRPKHLGWLVRAVPKRTRRFQLSALQSLIFNRVLVARMAAGGLDSWWEGDLVREASGRGWTAVPEARDLAPLDLGASGPLPGAGGPRPQGRALELEEEALAAEGLDLAAFAALPGPLRTPGTRRALRVPVEQVELDFAQDCARLAFTLGAGSYATTLLEELAKEHGP